MKSLKRINILLKVCRVICYILFACFIAGAAFCALAMGIINLVKDFDLGDGRTLTTTLAENNITINGVYTMLAMAIAGCFVGTFLSIYTAQFFKRTLKEENPFTRPVVKDLRKVALVNIFVNLGASILIGIGGGIAKAIDKGIGRVDNYSGLSIMFGLVLLLISLFVEYPVELEEQKKIVEAVPNEEEDKQ